MKSFKNTWRKITDKIPNNPLSSKRFSLEEIEFEGDFIPEFLRESSKDKNKLEKAIAFIKAIASDQQIDEKKLNELEAQNSGAAIKALRQIYFDAYNNTVDKNAFTVLVKELNDGFKSSMSFNPSNEQLKKIDSILSTMNLQRIEKRQLVILKEKPLRDIATELAEIKKEMQQISSQIWQSISTPKVDVLKEYYKENGYPMSGDDVDRRFTEQVPALDENGKIKTIVVEVSDMESASGQGYSEARTVYIDQPTSLLEKVGEVNFTAAQTAFISETAKNSRWQELASRYAALAETQNKIEKVTSKKEFGELVTKMDNSEKGESRRP